MTDRAQGYIDVNYIETGSGIRFEFLDPNTDMISIEDIANAISKQCRYTGHVHTFYSVAEHCCHLHDFTLDMTNNRENALIALMHDASEAYLSDIARPIKPHIQGYYDLEKVLEKKVAEKFNLEYPWPSWLKEIDTRILLDERAQAMNPSKNVWGMDHMKPLGVEIKFWRPERAQAEFLKRYYDARPV
jgi:uncharacterized protein